MRLKNLFHDSDEVSRRRFLGGSAASLLGVGAMPLFARLAGAQDPRQGSDDPVPLRAATAKHVIYLYMSGGMTHLDTFDTKPGAETQGPTKSIATNVDGIQVSEHFPLVARHMDKIAVVNSMQTTQGAHAQGRYFMHTSYVMRGTIRHPSLGAWLLRMAGKRNRTLPGHVSIGGDIYSASGGFMEPKYYPLPIGDPEAGLQNSKLPPQIDVERFHERLSRLDRMNRAFQERYDRKAVRAYTDMYDQAVKLMESRDLSAFDLNEEPDSARDAYGRDRFGQGCLLARRLVENNVRFVEVVSGGWDTHNQNFDAMQQRCPPLDRALAALLADLDSRGLLEETIVVLATEFGRTPRITAGRNGRDHYPKAFTCLLAGGGIKGGIKYGKTDGHGENVIENKVTVPDFNATIAHGLGLPVEHVIYSPSGRPFRVAHKGKPVAELFA